MHVINLRCCAPAVWGFNGSVSSNGRPPFVMNASANRLCASSAQTARNNSASRTLSARHRDRSKW